MDSATRPDEHGASQPDEHSGNEEYRRLLLSDGLAMACRFLPDQQLQSFLVRLHDVRRTRKHSPSHASPAGGGKFDPRCIRARS